MIAGVSYTYLSRDLARIINKLPLYLNKSRVILSRKLVLPVHSMACVALTSEPNTSLLLRFFHDCSGEVFQINAFESSL